jgi:hypothetical protein
MKHNSKRHLSHDTIFVYMIKKIGDLSNTSFFSLDSIEHIYIYNTTLCQLWSLIVHQFPKIQRIFPRACEMNSLELWH